MGEENPNVAISYNNIGLSLSKLDRQVEALEYFKKALEIAKEVLGEDHPTVATIYKNIKGSSSKLDTKKL